MKTLLLFVPRLLFKLWNWGIDRAGGYRANCICGGDSSGHSPCQYCGGISRGETHLSPNGEPPPPNAIGRRRR